jgi:hypothetical protein
MRSCRKSSDDNTAVWIRSRGSSEAASYKEQNGNRRRQGGIEIVQSNFQASHSRISAHERDISAQYKEVRSHPGSRQLRQGRWLTPSVNGSGSKLVALHVPNLFLSEEDGSETHEVSSKFID